MMLQVANRIHLFNSLDASQHLIVISAPAGCGKTMLARQLTDFLNCQVIWHSLDAWQADSKKLHKISCQLWSQAHSSLDTPESFDSASSAAYGLTQAIQTSISDPVCYVLDDVHHLAQSRDAELWLQTLVDTRPPNVYLIMVGRDLPHLNWYQEIGRGKVFWIDKKQLQFTADDILQMSKLSANEAQMLVERYNGWAAAIRLALDPRLSHVAQNALDSEAPEDALFKQLAARFFKQQSLSRQQVLLTLSTTQQISLPMCEQVFGLEGVYSHLENLYEEHLLLTKAGQHYQLHELFRDFLQEYLRRIQPQKYCYLHLKAAQWYEQENRLEEAIVHYLEADAKAQAIRLAEATAMELHVHGLWNTLLRLNTLLKHEEAPRLQLFASFVLADSHRLEDSNQQLMKAEGIFQQRGDRLNLARVVLQKAHNQQRQGHYTTALDLATQILHTPDLIETVKAWAYRIIGLACIDLGKYDEAILALKQVVSILDRETQNDYMYSHILQDLSTAYMRSGQFKEAIANLQEVVARFRSGHNLVVLALALNNLGSAFHCSSQYAAAFATLEEAHSLLPDERQRAAIAIYHSLGDLHRDIGDFAAATHAYELGAHYARQEDETFLYWISASCCRLALWQNQLVEAMNILQSVDIPVISQNIDERILHIWQEIMALWQHPHRHSSDTLIHHVQRLYQQNAIKALSKVLGSLGYIAIQFKIQLLLDLFQTLIGQISDEFLQPLVADAYHLPVLAHFLQTKTTVWQRLEPLYEELSTHIQVSRPTMSKYPKQLDLKMLGQDQVIFEGTPLLDTTWASPQARTFFYCLYFFGEQDKEQLTQRLWHDYTLTKARNALRDVRKRIKEVLPDVVIMNESSYALNPKFTVSADITAFKTTVLRANQLPRRDARTEELYLRAIQLYNVEGLLPNLYADFLIPFRQEYEELYLEALCGMADCVKARHDYASAIPYYERVLNIDPYQEVVYQEIMLCFANQRQMPQIQLTYNRLCDVLSDLGVEPQTETRALLDHLLI